MGKKVTLRALDHLLMASLLHAEGLKFQAAAKNKSALAKFEQAATHMQLAAESDDFADTVETLNSANEEGWEDEDEDEETASDDMDLDADMDDVDESEDAEEAELDMVADEEEEMEDEELQEETSAKVMGSILARTSKTVKAAADEDEGESEDDEEKNDEKASVLARRKRAQANVQRLKGKK